MRLQQLGLPGVVELPDMRVSGQLVLSLFPGIDLLGRGFEEVGFCVVRGPDLIFGGDVRGFTPPAGRFTGVIGGPPCQEFSRAKNGMVRSDYGGEMLAEFERVVLVAEPDWWLMENVERVPDVKIDGYNWQRLDVWAHEFGLKQRRLRHFQFGSKHGMALVFRRGGAGGCEPVVTASGRGSKTTWGRFCEAQGLPVGFDIPAFKRSEARRAVGNGVPLPMARGMAEIVAGMVPAGSVDLCECCCGRPISKSQTYARAACRMRAMRRRKSM